MDKYNRHRIHNQPLKFQTKALPPKVGPQQRVTLLVSYNSFPLGHILFEPSKKPLILL